MPFKPGMLFKELGMGSIGASWNTLKDVAWTNTPGLLPALGIGAGVGIGYNMLAHGDYSIWGNAKFGALGAGIGAGVRGMGSPKFKNAWATAKGAGPAAPVSRGNTANAMHINPGQADFLMAQAGNTMGGAAMAGKRIGATPVVTPPRQSRDQQRLRWLAQKEAERKSYLSR